MDHFFQKPRMFYIFFIPKLSLTDEPFLLFWEIFVKFKISGDLKEDDGGGVGLGFRRWGQNESRF